MRVQRLRSQYEKNPGDQSIMWWPGRSGSDLKSFGFQPRPTKGIFVAIMVMNCTFASSGKLAI